MSPATACHTCQGTAQTGFGEGADLGLCYFIHPMPLETPGRKGESYGEKTPV